MHMPRLNHFEPNCENIVAEIVTVQIVVAEDIVAQNELKKQKPVSVTGLLGIFANEIRYLWVNFKEKLQDSFYLKLNIKYDSK